MRRLALAILVLAACSKQPRSGQGQGAGAASADGGVLVAEPSQLVPPTAPSVTLLRYLDPGTRFALVVDLAAVRRTPMFAALAASVGGPRWLARTSLGNLTAGCHFDAGSDVDRVLVGSDDPKLALAGGALIAQGRFDEASLMACITRNLASQHRQLTSEQHHGHTIYRLADGAAVVFLAPHTVALGRPGWVRGRAAGGLAGPPPLADLAAQLDTSKPVWLVSRELLTGPSDPREVTGTITLDTGLDAHLFQNFGDEEQAQRVADSTRSQTSLIGQMFGAIETTRQGTRVAMHISMDADHARRLVGLLGPSMP